MEENDALTVEDTGKLLYQSVWIGKHDQISYIITLFYAQVSLVTQYVFKQKIVNIQRQSPWLKEYRIKVIK